jgi:hypothetical protein
MIKEIKRVLDLIHEIENKLKTFPDYRVDERLDRLLEDVNDLLERVHKIELAEVNSKTTWKTIFSKGFEWTLKAILFVGISYAFAKLGLDNIAIPSPF